MTTIGTFSKVLSLVDSTCTLARQTVASPPVFVFTLHDCAKMGKRVIKPLQIPPGIQDLMKSVSSFCSAHDIEGKVIYSSETLLGLLDTLSTTLSVAQYMIELPPSLAASLTPLSIYTLAGNILLGSYKTLRAREVYYTMDQLREIPLSGHLHASVKKAEEMIEKGEISAELFKVLLDIQGKCVTIGELMFLNGLITLAGLLLLTATVNPIVPTLLLTVSAAVGLGLSVYKESLTLSEENIQKLQLSS